MLAKFFLSCYNIKHIKLKVNKYCYKNAAVDFSFSLDFLKWIKEYVDIKYCGHSTGSLSRLQWINSNSKSSNVVWVNEL